MNMWQSADFDIDKDPNLVLVLHPLGGSGRSMLEIYEPFLGGNTVALAPDSPFNLYPGRGFSAYRWFTNTGENEVTMDDLLHSTVFLDNLMDELDNRLGLPFNSFNRRVITGFSQGGTMSITCPFMMQNKFTDVYNFAGYMAEDQAIEIKSHKVEKTRLNWYHGNLDVENPFDWSLKGLENLKNHGINPIFIEGNYGHSIDAEGMESLRDLLTGN